MQWNEMKDEDKVQWTKKIAAYAKCVQIFTSSGSSSFVVVHSTWSQAWGQYDMMMMSVESFIASAIHTTKQRHHYFLGPPTYLLLLFLLFFPSSFVILVLARL